MATALSFLRNPRVKGALIYIAGAGVTYAFINNTEAQDKRLWNHMIETYRLVAWYHPLGSYCQTKFTIRKLNPVIYTMLWPITIGYVTLKPVVNGIGYVVTFAGYNYLKLIAYPGRWCMSGYKWISKKIKQCISIDK